MATPSKKSEGIEQALRNLMGVDRRHKISHDRCVSCDGVATDFKDDLSRREYSISGLCQKCQDEVFGG